MPQALTQFFFQRLDGQPPLPERDLEAEAASKALKTEDSTVDEDSEVETEDEDDSDAHEGNQVKEQDVIEDRTVNGEKVED